MKPSHKTDSVGGQKILIVEDHKALRRALRDWLASYFEGCRFMDVGSGEEAVALSTREPPDIVLMDVGLPGIDGIEATRQIKAAAPATHVVVLTIHEESVYRAAAAKAGASAFVPKRKMHTELIPVLSQIMDPKLVTNNG
jgi:DNA-binding NarL/FixJ family response regulator